VGRLEFKYLVPWGELDRLRRALAPFVEIDSFAGAEPDQQYTVRSIYFDTPGLACYVQKEAGIHTRRKLRIRGYGAPREDSLVVLEIKRKLDMRVSKNRAFLPFAGLEQLLSSGDVERFILTRGAAFAVVLDNQGMGKTAATLARQLLSGSTASATPPIGPEKVRFKVNRTVVNKLGIPLAPETERNNEIP